VTAPPPYQAETVLAGRYRLDAPVSPAADDGSQSWRATDTVLARPVFVELGPPGSATASNQGLVAAAGKIAHPNIAAVYDTGSGDERSWVVVEFPRGHSLRTLVDQHGPMSSDRTTLIGRQVAAALRAAHEAGVAHGHLDLERVMVTDDDRVKVVGFTGIGSTRQDVAAAGEVLYELLCGHPPDPDDPSSPRQLRPGIPAGLDNTVMGALGYGTAEPSRAAALLAALASVDTGGDDATPDVVRDPTPPIGVIPVARHHSRRPWEARVVALAVLAVALVAVVVVLLVWSGPKQRASSPPGRAAGSSVPIAAVAAFDPPPGDLHENDANLPRLVDGNPATVWSTEFYSNRNFGNLKHGVGVSLTLTRNTKLRALVINSTSRNWKAEVYVASQPATTLAGWGHAANTPLTVTSPVTNIDLHGATGTALLLWITDLGDGVPPMVSIGELTVLS
jgi:putative peptidoglycan lipid II flippase